MVQSPGDPEEIVKATDVLTLRAGLRFVAYQYRAGGNGNGIVWALPVDAPFPEPDECERLNDEFAKAPRPRKRSTTSWMQSRETVPRGPI